MSITKNVFLNWYFFNEQKIEKDSDDFFIQKIDFESEILALFETSPNTNSQNSIIFFRYLDF